LLERLHNLVDAVSWLRRQKTRGAVLSEIRIRLNDFPEQPYPQGLWEAKVEQVSDFLLRRYA
jgi:type I restriction enzyme R subunit